MVWIEVNDEEVRLDAPNFCSHALHISLSIEIKLTVDISQALYPEV